MRSNKKIAVVLPDTLLFLGLQSLFDNFFPEVEVCHLTSFKEVSQKQQNDSFSHYLTDTDTFILHLDYFLPRRSRTMILQANAESLSLPTNMISTKQPLEQMIDQLEHWFSTDDAVATQTEKGKGLSEREINVLQQIVKGYTNKEIADHLSISLNTVLTHRKNITAKLGIKTVSGLTFYAMMNGIVSVEEINI